MDKRIAEQRQGNSRPKNEGYIISQGYRTYHNYFKEHEGSRGRAPTEPANISIEGGIKWMPVFQNAAEEN